MSVYEIKLRYEETFPGKDSVLGQVAQIVARDPLQDLEFPISPTCVSIIEILHETDRLRKALDSVDREAKRRFDGHEKKVRATSRS